jgi:hypothetical protein
MNNSQEQLLSLRFALMNGIGKVKSLNDADRQIATALIDAGLGVLRDLHTLAEAHKAIAEAAAEIASEISYVETEEEANEHQS